MALVKWPLNRSLGRRCSIGDADSKKSAHLIQVVVFMVASPHRTVVRPS